MSEVNLLIPVKLDRDAMSANGSAFGAGRLSGATMGTHWSAAWYAPPALAEERVADTFETCFAEMIAAFSTWEQSSQVSRFNCLAAGESLQVDPRVIDVLESAIDIAVRSAGAFDPCLGAQVWRRGFGGPGCASGNASSFAGNAVWTTLLPGDGTLRQPGGVVLDLSAIAKGYAVDEMARALAGLGVARFLVEIGGEFAACGVKPEGMPWWVDIETTFPAAGAFRIALCGAALATSGDYRQVRIADGEKVSHIVPHPSRTLTGGDLASVSVVHASCAVADAWATALFAAGDEQGMEIAEREGLAALFQYRDSPARLSRCLQGWLA